MGMHVYIFWISHAVQCAPEFIIYKCGIYVNIYGIC
jgi:hypothetical protein